MINTARIRTPGLSMPAGARLPRLAPYWASVLLYAAIGVEIAMLAAWLPGTLDSAWNEPNGDFRNLYEPARDLSLVGLYSPFLAPLLHPLTYLGELRAFRAVFFLNALSLLILAWIAQRPLPNIEAKLAVALGVLSIPQLHWAVRLGHLTPMLALVALLGLLTLQRRPVRGAMLLALLSIKPQYAVAPFIQLLRDRRLDLAAIMLATAAALATAGFIAIGPSEAREYASIALDWGPDSRDNLLPVQQSWLYSWPGVQISFGVEPHPLITAQLLALSLATVMLAWANAAPMTRACVTAFAMLLLTPYAQFYDFGMVAVGLALMLRCGFDARFTATVWVGLWLAASLTQANTIFPTNDALGPAQTAGAYWLTPAILLVVAAIAVVGKQARQAELPDGD